MTSRTWLLVGILLALVSFSAFAEESIPATATPNQYPGQYSWSGTNNVKFPTDLQAAQDKWDHATPAQDQYCDVVKHPAFITTLDSETYHHWNASLTTSNCTSTYQNKDYGYVESTVSRANVCAAGYTWNSTTGYCVGASTYSCPSNGGWTLVNQSCVRDSCVEGEIRNEETGVCAPPVPQCSVPDGSAITGGYYNVGTSGSGSPPPAPCLSSCRATFEGNGPYEVVIAGVKNYFIKGIYYSTGAVCSPDTPIVDGTTGLPSSSCGPNQSSGTINGKTICVDNTTNQPVPTDSPKTETKTENTTTNPDGSSTTTTTTNHIDGTSTTSTTTTATDGTKTTTVITNGGYSENPSDGSATETTQKQILDELKKDDCEANPDRIGCMEQGTIEDNSVIPQIDLVASFTPEFSSAGSCPAPQTIVKGGVTITADYSMICYYASALRPFVLAFALLSAALIVVGVRKESD